ncbi:MAG: hypothetical protein HKO59_02285 [Phycisphaerales bacterium]|nr:hypothetical protein [Phycisphaerales bacterium]NNM24811.1 hypothetical protein [Phycisphaerales bacterium]
MPEETGQSRTGDGVAARIMDEHAAERSTAPDDPPAPPAPMRRRRRRRRSKRRVVGRVVLVLFVLFVAGAGFAWWRSQQAPDWFAPPDPAAADVAALAEQVEYGIVEEFHRIRSDDAWTLRVRDDQVNAWLATRMPEWVAHEQTIQWPEEFGTPQLRFTPAGIDLAVDVHVGDGTQVLVTRLTPRFERGRLLLDIDKVGLGRLNLPGAVATKTLDLIEQIAPGGVIDPAATHGLLGVLGGNGTVDASIALPDGRRVQLIDMLARDGAVDLTSRTLPPP